MRHEPIGHIVPLAGVFHGGGGRLPRLMAEGDVCHGADPLPEVSGPRSKQPSDADRQGKQLLRGEPVDAHAQVLGRRLFCVVAGAAGVAFQACVVQMRPPPGWKVSGGGLVGLLPVLVPASRRAPLPGAPRLSGVRSAALLAVACPSFVAVACSVCPRGV